MLNSLWKAQNCHTQHSIYLVTTGNKCLPGITVIGSLNASEKPFKMSFVFLHCCKQTGIHTLKHSHTDSITSCSPLSQLISIQMEKYSVVFTDLLKWTQTLVKLNLHVMFLGSNYFRSQFWMMSIQLLTWWYFTWF